MCVVYSEHLLLQLLLLLLLLLVASMGLCERLRRGNSVTLGLTTAEGSSHSMRSVSGSSQVGVVAAIPI
jgi:hypothetical protein